LCSDMLKKTSRIDDVFRLVNRVTNGYTLH